MIFKIKNDLLDKIKNKEEIKNNNDNNIEDAWILKEGPEYEEKMIKEILKKIVPTFCQDIMLSLIHI